MCLCACLCVCLCVCPDGAVAIAKELITSAALENEHIAAFNSQAANVVARVCGNVTEKLMDVGETMLVKVSNATTKLWCELLPPEITEAARHVAQATDGKKLSLRTVANALVPYVLDKLYAQVRLECGGHVAATWRPGIISPRDR